jgi:hypothetical protein
MLTADPSRLPALLADILPNSDVLRARLLLLDAEAALLRRLLAVALRREREAERLAREGVSLCRA